jgi:outer membrane cobalamin receptor
MNLKLFIILFTAFLIPYIALSQIEVDTTDDVKFNLLLNEAIEGQTKYNFNLLNSGNSMQIITADEIEKLGLNSFAEILQYSADILISNDGTWTYGGARGLNFNTSCGIRMPLTLNGVQLTDYTFGSVLNSNIVGIPLEFIERIELINGPPSAIYGSSAMFGAINIITKRGKDIDGAIISSGINSFGETNASMILGNKWENGLDVLFTYKLNYFGGNDMYFREYDNTNSEYGNPESPLFNNRARNKGIADKKNSYLSNMFFLNAKYENLELLGMYSMAKRAYPDAPFSGIFNDSNANMDVLFATTTLKYNIIFNGLGVHNIVPQLQYLYSRSELGYNYEELDEENNIIVLNQIERPLFIGISGSISDIWEITPSNLLIFGLNYTQSIENDVKFLYGYGNLDEVEEGKLKPLSVFEVYGEYTHEFSEMIRVFVGMKYFEAQSNSALLPRVGFIFDFNDYGTIKALFGTASKHPSGYEEYTNTIWDTTTLKNVLDTKMQNEYSKSFELMYLYRNTKIQSNFSLFYNILSDIVFLDYYPESKDPYYLYHYINMDPNIKINNYGISASFSYQTNFGLSFSIRDMFNFVNVKGQSENNFYLDETLNSNSPRNVLCATVSYKVFDFVYVNLMGRFETSRKSYNPLAEKYNEDGVLISREFIDLAPIQVLNTSITYNPDYIENKFINRFSFALYCNNILNRDNNYPVCSLLYPINKYPLDSFSVGINIKIKI